MKIIWQKIKSLVKSLFNRETVSVVWQILFSEGKSTVSQILANTEVMNAAYHYASSLFNSSADSADKRATFNRLMTEFLTAKGQTVGTSILNVIRETAYAAVKAEAECASGTCSDN